MSLQKLTHPVIVNGEKPYKNCQPHREFTKRLKKAIEVANKENIDGIIVSGGATRKNCSTESSFGAQYLQGLRVPIFTEEHSHTTIENIRFVKQLLINNSLEKLIVISSQKRLLRLKYLYNRIWPEMRGKVEFVGAPDSYGIYFYFLELAYLVYSIFDINEHVLPRLTKKFFRNT